MVQVVLHSFSNTPLPWGLDSAYASCRQPLVFVKCHILYLSGAAFYAPSKFAFCIYRRLSLVSTAYFRQICLMAFRGCTSCSLSGILHIPGTRCAYVRLKNLGAKNKNKNKKILAQEKIICSYEAEILVYLNLLSKILQETVGTVGTTSSTSQLSDES